jgi:hypothetical protein
MAQKKIYVIVHKQYGNESEAFKKIYPFTSRLAAAKKMVKLYNAAVNGENYVSPVHYGSFGRFTTYNPLNIDSFHVSCKHGNEQCVELVAKSEGEPLDL